WRWEEAEALLVAGLTEDEDEPHEGVGDLADQLGIHQQWRSLQVPDGVLTSWGEEVAEIDGVLGDDPAFGLV
ncbi:hypothetical protein QWJ41_21790, partial [Nocardioides sp. SOB44]